MSQELLKTLERRNQQLAALYEENKRLKALLDQERKYSKDLVTKIQDKVNRLKRGEGA